MNFDLYPEAIKEFMELFSAACHCTKHYQGSLSYDDPMRWAYLFGDPFWKSAVSFDEFSGGEGTGRTKQENDMMIDVVTLDEILEMVRIVIHIALIESSRIIDKSLKKLLFTERLIVLIGLVSMLQLELNLKKVCVKVHAKVCILMRKTTMQVMSPNVVH